MSISWLLYALVIALLLTCAAHAAESLLRLTRLPTRFVWLTALAASLTLPAVLPLLPTATPEPTGFLPAIFSLQLAPVAGSVEASFWTSERIVAAVWVAVSLLLLAVGLLLQLRLRRASRGWRRDHVDGADVLVSEVTGPAVVGVFRPRIVLPDWALNLSAEERRLVLLHESEHIRARDPMLLLFGTVAVVAAPWNLPMWYQLARLRRAVELDCDSRLLRCGIAVRPYAALLLDVCERVTGGPLPVAAFAERKSLLETRIRAMTARVPRYRQLRAAGWGAAALALIVVACEAPIPGEPLSQKNMSAAGTRASQQDESEPHFTRYTQAPTLSNQAEVVRAMVRNYPPLLRDAGVDGVALLWVHIDATGSVLHTRLKTSSGHLALDDAALKVIQVAKFTPARDGGNAVPVWVEMPVQFKTGVTPNAEAARTSKANSIGLDNPQTTRKVNVAPTPGDAESAPNSAAPVLVNQDEVVRAMTQQYPPLLRDAGIGGTVELWVQVDENGTVTGTRMKNASGHTALDQAALRVAEVMKFTPPRNRGTPVKTWIALPIQFRTS